MSSDSVHYRDVAISVSLDGMRWVAQTKPHPDGPSITADARTPEIAFANLAQQMAVKRGGWPWRSRDPMSDARLRVLASELAGKRDDWLGGVSIARELLAEVMRLRAEPTTPPQQGAS